MVGVSVAGVLLAGCAAPGVPVGPGQMPSGTTRPTVAPPTGGLPAASGAITAAGSQCGGPFDVRRQPQTLPSTFQVAAVYECQAQVEAIPGQGRWVVAVERKATRGLSTVVSDLRQPDASVRGTVVCAAVAVITPDVLVESTTGQLIAPRLPIDVCAQPQQQVLTALRALSWTTVSSRPVRQVETQAEVVSGCPPAAKDLFTLQAGQLYPSAGGPVFPQAATSVTVCVYRDVGSPSGAQIGQFAGAGTLTGAAATSVLDGISATPGVHPQPPGAQREQIGQASPAAIAALSRIAAPGG